MAKGLKRSKKDKMIAGVCGGLGEYFDIDPNIIRIIFVAFTLLGGSGVLVYIIMWLVVPREGEILIDGADLPNMLSSVIMS